MDMDMALIGLGQMGSGMAARLAWNNRDKDVFPDIPGEAEWIPLPVHPKNTDVNELAWTTINKKPAIS